jgi:hypothetical protein
MINPKRVLKVGLKSLKINKENKGMKISLQLLNN